jgi:hypothetical protein
MTERPILFRAEMVRAVLDGRKTQTRRVMKPQNRYAACGGDWKANAAGGMTLHVSKSNGQCPYGEAGDDLWVRERQEVTNIMRNEDGRPIAVQVSYRADDCESAFIGYPERLKGEPVVGKCLSYGGYRESSRIHLEVTGVRVERVQDISEGDAKAEGASGCKPSQSYAGLEGGPCRSQFRMLWDSINLNRGFGWKSNPWVWVVEFKRWPS